MGALMLAPNALRILDSLGLYQQLRRRGFNFSTVEFRDQKDTVNDRWQMGNRDRYGYDALRITRPAFLDVLRAAVDERCIKVKYSARYSHIVEETQDGVTFQLGDGTRLKAGILVGADGVYSEVRKSIAPTLEPIYSGNLALLATTRRRFANEDASAATKPPQTTFYYGPSSAVLVMPQEHDGSQACLGTQRKYPEQSREDWVHLNYDKDKLYDLFMQNSSEWPDRVQDAMAQIDKHDIYIWPFYTLPDLPSWTSLPHRRTILIGDSSTSIPPTGGQGACQAIETAYTLAMVISTISKISNFPPESYTRSITSWQSARQERVRKAKLFTQQLGNNRLPPAERAAKLPPGTYWEAGQHPDLSWLYGAGLANSQAKGVTRVEVHKSPGGKGGAVTRVRAATVDGVYGLDENVRSLERVGTGDVVKGAC